MKTRYQIKVVAAIGAAALVLLSGCSNSSQTSTTQAASSAGVSTEAKTEAAVLEGKITLYTSQPEADAQALVEAFNNKYPKITVDVFRSGTEEVISKVQAEKQTNSLQADVLLLSDACTFESLKEQDLLLSYESPELQGIDSSYYDAEHTYTGTKIITTGIAVNTDLIQNVPASLADLMKAEYKDEITMPSPLYSGAASYNLSIITRTDGLGWTFYEKLKENNVLVGKGNGGVQTALVNGEKGIGLLVDYMAIRAKAQGAPIEFIYPSEGSLSVTEPIAILKDSKKQDLAKVFVDFILSEDGQKATAEIGYTPIKSGVEAPEGFRSADEINNLTYSMDTILQERENDKKLFSDMFGG